MEQENLPKIGITIGDVNGIGPEVLLKALNSGRIQKICIPIIYGSGKLLSKYKNLIDLSKWQYSNINNASQASSRNFNLINVPHPENMDLELGKSTKEAGALALAALEKATADLKSGAIQALVTAPISKDNIQSDTFKFPGHTEYLAHAYDKKEVLMFMVSDLLRVGVVTGHLPLDEVKKNLNTKSISLKLSQMLDSLKVDFNIPKPKIAVLGLNPHAGENGLLGKEEKEIISPVIEEFQKNGHMVFGPYPSDGFFANAQYNKFDGILAMYHDQGLMPFKMLAFENGVNFTAGLLGIRTSPDHGTAYDIAGKNVAEASSMTHAIYTAIDVYKNRKEFVELEKNALKNQNIDLSMIKKEKQ
jgi:4-hydroxythreonine-4-phosphate dehydrogenase